MSETDELPDVLVLGRLGVDLYPTRSGVGLEQVDFFQKSLGGSAANVSVATARYGHRVALISGVGRDPLGRYLLAELARFGVDARGVIVDPVHSTPITLCEIFPPDDFPLYFYREPTAPDLQIAPDELDPAVVRAARIVWMTVTGLSREPSRSTHAETLRIRDRAAQVVLDLDYRPVLWPDPRETAGLVAGALDGATVAVGNREECRVAVGETDPNRAADALLERGLDLAIVKLGPEGVLGKTRDETVVVPPFPVEVVNGLGAGDAFGGALCHGLLEGWSLDRTLRYANAAGAIVAGRLECSSAMPDAAEVDAVVRGETSAGTRVVS